MSSDDDDKKTKVKLDPKELVIAYKKLAQDANKIKKENAILKRAVLQEQQTTKDLAESLKNKDISLRELEERNVRLSYNYDRLKKEMASLQEMQSPKKSSSWFGFTSKEELNNAQQEVQLLSEELDRRNSDIVKLHDDIDNVKRQSDQTAELLQNKITKLKQDLNLEHEKLTSNEASYERNIQELTLQKDKLAETSAHLSQEVNILKRKLEAAISGLETLRSEHKMEQLKSTDIITRQVKFDDTFIPKFNAFNVPTYDKTASNKLKDSVVKILHSVLPGLVGSIVSEHEVHNERIIFIKKTRDMDKSLYQMYDKIIEVTVDFRSIIDNLYGNTLQVLRIFLNDETADDSILKKQVDLMNSFLLQQQKQLYWEILGLQEESKQRDCVKFIQQLNTKLVDLKNKFHNSLEKLSLSLSLLSSQETSSKKEQLIETIYESVKELRSTKNDMLEVLTTKFNKEDEDPYVEPKQKEIHSKYLISTKSVLDQIGELEKILNGYVNLIAHPPSNKPVRGVILPIKTAIEFTTDLAKKSASLLSILNTTTTTTNDNHPPKSIPYEQQIENEKMLESLKMMMEGSIAQIEEKTSAIKKLSDERELLNSQLVNTKDTLASKQNQLTRVMEELANTRKKLTKTTDLLKNMANKNNGNSSTSDGVTDTNQINTIINTLDKDTKTDAEALSDDAEFLKSGKKWSLTVIDEDGKESNSLNFSKEDKEREQKLKQFYEDKCSQLQSQLKLVDDKVIEMMNRKEFLEQQVESSKQEKSKLQTKLSLLTETLESTSNNYESQLKVLTEHVVDLNEKITRDELELETIKAQKVKCGKCKAWNTIGWLVTEGNFGSVCSGGNHHSSFNFA
eukprot:TRINITY_DN9579_c0_g1_i1.p1 TRINITY_DN9579_c0_g1~~TRINITY_DN9579_c0_g1_i1.p1  ORF type:complete len:850 (-),score=239.02 TRINITY_DN9579_c0_g1_i1:23-2572(-)